MSQTQLEYAYSRKVLASYKNPLLVGTDILPILTVVDEKVGFFNFSSTSNIIPAGVKREAGAAVAEFTKGTFTTDKIELEERSGYRTMDVQEIAAMKSNAKQGGLSVNYKMLIAKEALSQLELNKEKDIADALQATANYTHTNHATPSAKWDTTSGDPIGDIDTAMDIVKSKIGIAPNVAWMSDGVWSVLKRNAKILDLLKTTVDKRFTTEWLASYLGLDKIIVGAANYATSIGSDSKTAIWGKNFGLCYINTQMNSTEAPTFGATVQHIDLTQTFVFEEKEFGKITNVCSTQFYNPAILQDQAGYLWTAVIS